MTLVCARGLLRVSGTRVTMEDGGSVGGEVNRSVGCTVEEALLFAGRKAVDLIERVGDGQLDGTATLAALVSHQHDALTVALSSLANMSGMGA